MEKLISVEVRWWYDWTAYYIDQANNKYSVIGKMPMDDDELCLRWMIYKVKWIDDYTPQMLSSRKDVLSPNAK